MKKSLNKAIDEAWRYQLLTYPNPAVGCVIVKNNNIISSFAHQKSGEVHAELGAIKDAFLKYYPNSKLKDITNPFEIETFILKNHNNFFKDTIFFVTLEPCSHVGKTPSCANIISHLKPKKVIIGVKDKNKIASKGADLLEKVGIKTIILHDKNSQDLIYPFQKWNEGKFIFFKMAIRSDGSNDGIISSQDSFRFIHKIRSKLDLLVIGGNTVRVDRPTLDARLVKGKAPDILIYSNKKDFDKNINLFNIKDRKVTISNSLDFNNKRFIMIEGGYNLYEHLKNKIDMLLLIVSHKVKRKIDIEERFNKKAIYSYFINDTDEIIYLI